MLNPLVEVEAGPAGTSAGRTVLSGHSLLDPSSRLARIVRAAVMATCLAVIVAAVGGWAWNRSVVQPAGSTTAGAVPTAARTAAPTSASSGRVARAGGAAPSASSAAPQQVDVSPYVLTAAQVSPLKIKLIAGGSGLQQPTLDNCGFRFATESRRVARRQVELFTPTGASTGVSQEVVAYDSDAAAAAALAEWQTSVATCRPGTVARTAVSTQGDGVSVRWESEATQRIAGWPIAANTMTRVRMSPASGPMAGRTVYGIIILQQQGRTLDAIYGFGSGVGPQSLTVMLGLARLAQQNLTAQVTSV
jgi:hypothetical protein